jgi:hypothetical protein
MHKNSKYEGQFLPSIPLSPLFLTPPFSTQSIYQLIVEDSRLSSASRFTHRLKINEFAIVVIFAVEDRLIGSGIVKLL